MWFIGTPQPLLWLLRRATGAFAAPPMVADRRRDQAFENVPRDGRIEYDLEYPRHQFLRWLGTGGDVLFHGSNQTGLTKLEPIRLSTDPSAFGAQQAVFASGDPLWAMWFAILNKASPSFTSTRNGCIGIRSSANRSYFFAVNEGSRGPSLFVSGAVYVVSRRSFRPEQRQFRLLDTGQWASSETAPVLAWLPVSPADFPFLERVITFEPHETWRTTYARLRSAVSAPRSPGGPPGAP